MQQRQGAHGSGFWSVPGGHLEFSESLEETAKREVREETGLEINNVRTIGITNDIMKNDGKHYITVWMVSNWESGDNFIAEPQKCQAQKWCSFDHLPSPLWPTPWDNLRASDFYDQIKLAAKAL